MGPPRRMNGWALPLEGRQWGQEGTLSFVRPRYLARQSRASLVMQKCIAMLVHFLLPRPLRCHPRAGHNRTRQEEFRTTGQL